MMHDGGDGGVLAMPSYKGRNNVDFLVEYVVCWVRRSFRCGQVPDSPTDSAYS